VNRLDGKAKSVAARGIGQMATAVAAICQGAGGARWCSGCLAAHGAWNAACPRCGRALVVLERPSGIKREAA
jgi:DNA-directed RNA polymerase subunit RPC12/RpoP